MSDPGPSTVSHLNNDIFYSFGIALAITGFVYLVSKVTSFLRLLISLFIFPALPVCTLVSSCGRLVTSESASMLPTDCFLQAPCLRSAFVLGDCYRRLGWHWQGFRYSTRAARVQHPSRLANRIKAPISGFRDPIQMLAAKCYQNLYNGFYVEH